MIFGTRTPHDCSPVVPTPNSSLVPMVSATIGVRIIKGPVRAPRVNALAEGRVSSARRECLNWMLIADERHLRLVLGEYVDHYNVHRPHRTSRQNSPAGRAYAPAGKTGMRVV